MKRFRFVSILLVCLVLVFVLVGCSKQSNQSNQSDQSNQGEQSNQSEQSDQSDQSNQEEDKQDGIDTSKYTLYDTGTGLSLYLDKGMSEQDAEASGLTTFYANNSYMMAALKESNEIFEDAGLDTQAFSLEDYGVLVKAANDFDGDFTEDSYGNLRITYSANVNGNDYFYYSTIRKGSDGYWLIHFACLESSKAEYEPIFEMLGNTIEVK